MTAEKFLHKIAILVIIFFFTTKLSLYSQPTWQWIQPKPTGNFLYSVHFADQLTGYTVGTFGTIIKTTNGGINWTAKNSNTTQDLSEVFFINTNTGIVAGKSGIILKTTDAGESWLVKNSNVSVYLHDIYFPSCNTGYVVGLNGAILKTTDMGDNWIQLTSGTNAPLFCVDFLNQNTGVAGGYNIILKTINGGMNWVNENAGIISFSSVVGISISDNNQIVGAGNSPGGMFYKTTNQGQNWQHYTLGLPYLFGGSVDLVRSLDFLNIHTGYIVTDFGTILKTVNGGSNWFRDSSFRPSYEKLSIMYDVNVFGLGIVNIVGNGGNIIKTSDDGLTWFGQSGNKKTLRGNYFIDMFTGYCVGERGTIMKTADGGNSWINYSSGTTKFLNSIFFIDEHTGYICGDSGIILKSIITKSRWRIQPVKQIANLNSICFLNKDTGLVAGGDESNSNAVILRTTNAGIKWSAVYDSASLGVLKSIGMLNKNIWIVVGNNGNVLRSNDSGLNWYCENITQENLNSVSFTDSLNGIIAGTNGLLFKTTDCGLKWFSVFSGIFSNLYSVKYMNDNYALAAGENGRIINSDNGGNSWKSEQQITNNNIHSVNILNSNNFIAFGEYGTIINSILKSPVAEELNNDQAADNYNLSQNYPNPFNPSTNINFRLNSPAHVKLSVQNILGQEVFKLADEKKEAGLYKIIFEASSLSSGIYFYSLILDDVKVDTKRMVLLK
ncbi:MAG: YCF48-related protein [Bacteroidota bacterium]|nr:YCF48-related protein [Bacteroidota bacterium]